MSKLNNKQTKTLKEMSAEQLTEIIYSLIRNNKQAKSLLINNYLTSPNDVLKKAEKEYHLKIKSSRFYSYYEADSFFADIYREIVFPLERTVSILPEKTELFCQHLLLTFNTLCETADTSRGSWMDYYNDVVAIWLKSLALQKNKKIEVIAEKIMMVLNGNNYFNFASFDHYKKDIGYDVIRYLRDILFNQNDVNEAVELSLYIRDIDFIRQCFNAEKLKQPEYIIKFAELLIDELCPKEAIITLNKIENKKILEYSELSDSWTKVFIQALIEEGKTQQAKDYCIEKFKDKCNVMFYNIYNKLDPSVKVTNTFINIAKEAGTPFVIQFLTEISDYNTINQEILNLEKSDLLILINFCRGSFIRSLSNDLYKLGHVYSALILHRALVENYINRSQSKYYGYAASDLKKSIDYSKKIVWTAQVPSTADYLNTLFSKHKKKHSLWRIMQQKIAGLTIENNYIFYKPIK